MARMTRVASQARTRTRLVDTAQELFLRDGYVATSLERVAEAAGYSKGAVYSNFAGKDELCLAVIDRLLSQRGGELLAVAGTGGGLDGMLDAFERWLESVVGDEGWSSLVLEVAAQARHDAGLRRAVAERVGAIRAALALVIAAATADTGLELPLPPDEVATTVLGAGLGLALQRAFDPAVPARVLGDAVRVAVAAPRAAHRTARPTAARAGRAPA